MQVVKVFPILFKKSSKGKIEQWEISVAEDGQVAQIITNFGEHDGKVQTTSDTISEGKNTGRSNATNYLEQALAEAQSKYEKKLKSGYIDNIDKAKAGETDSIIEGGIVPMLAHVYDDHKSKIKFPCLVQPKLDGIRCIAIKNGKEVTLWSRTRKPITSCPHIQEAIVRFFSDVNELILDGELYNHEMATGTYGKGCDLIEEGQTPTSNLGFEAIVSAVRKEEPSKESELVEYHIYDVCSEERFRHRMIFIHDTMKVGDGPLKVVPTYMVDESDVDIEHDKYVSLGYEGVMLRNTESHYENKRSYNLQKYKKMQDSEYEIIGAEEGRGKLQGHLGAFICKTSDGTKFKVKMSGAQELSKEYWENREEYIGRDVTIQYQALTGASKVPRFPVGLRVRELGL